MKEQRTQAFKTQILSYDNQRRYLSSFDEQYKTYIHFYFLFLFKSKRLEVVFLNIFLSKLMQFFY